MHLLTSKLARPRRQRKSIFTRLHDSSPTPLQTLEQRLLLAADPIITEFMADNDNTLDDGFGRSSDWIEIFNAGDQPADLSTHHLTDDPLDLDKWTFPANTILDPGQFLVVFASGENTIDPASSK